MPVILTSQADSSAYPHGLLQPSPSLFADARRPLNRILTGGVTIMDTILVVNAGSSSVKFRVFENRLRQTD